MSNWRPEGWTVATGMRLYKGKLLGNTREAFEAGADVMLKAVCEQIKKVELPEYKKSWIVMTPEDTRQKILDHLCSNNEYD